MLGHSADEERAHLLTTRLPEGRHVTEETGLDAAPMSSKLKTSKQGGCLPQQVMSRSVSVLQVLVGGATLYWQSRGRCAIEDLVGTLLIHCCGTCSQGCPEATWTRQAVLIRSVACAIGYHCCWALSAGYSPHNQTYNP